MSVRNVIYESLTTPVKEQVDVLVCGGGPAGCIAALAAARANLSVRLVEPFGFLGGVITAAGVSGIGGWQHDLDGRPLISGLAEEIISAIYLRSGNDPAALEYIFSQRSGRPDYREGGLGCYWLNINPECCKIVLDEYMAKAGVKTLFMAQAVRPVMNGNRVIGVAVESKSGREIILARVVIDATGDGDIAARAGAPFAIGRPSDGACQPMSQIFLVDNCTAPDLHYDQNTDDPEPDPLAKNRYRAAVALARECGEITLNPNDILCAVTPLHQKSANLCTVNFTRVQKHSSIDAEQLSDALVQGRRQVAEGVNFMRKYVKGSSEASLAVMYPHIGIRESRRITGDYVLTGNDVRSGARFPDSIARGIYLLDIHNADESGKPSELIYLDQPYDIPYRSLLPLGVEGILTAGRCISGDHMALASYRIVSHCMATGEAAGTAAALSVNGSCTPRELDFRKLRTELAKNGANTGCF